MAGLYIFLSLFTAVIFILTRPSTVSVIKRNILTVRLDLTFFAITLYKRDNTKKKKSSPEHLRKILERIKRLLALSKIEVKRLNIPVFPKPTTPSGIPLFSANNTLNYILLAFISSFSKEMTVAECESDDDSIYHLILKTPLICLLYTLLLISFDVLKENKMKKRLNYVGHKNG